jgi:hypothetical protein
MELYPPDSMMHSQRIPSRQFFVFISLYILFIISHTVYNDGYETVVSEGLVTKLLIISPTSVDDLTSWRTGG